MLFSEEDNHMIMSLREKKQFNARRFLTEIPIKNSARNGLDYLMTKIDTDAAVTRLSGSGRPRTAALLHYYTAALLHYCTAALLHCCTTTQLHCCTAALQTMLML